MNRQNIKLFLFFIIGLLTAFLVMYFLNNYKIEKKIENSQKTEIGGNNQNSSHKNDFKENASSENRVDID